MLVHLRATPQLYVAGTHLYTWMNREKVDSEVSCLRKQREGRGLNPCVPGVNHSATQASTEEHQPNFKHKGERIRLREIKSRTSALLISNNF